MSSSPENLPAVLAHWQKCSTKLLLREASGPLADGLPFVDEDWLEASVLAIDDSRFTCSIKFAVSGETEVRTFSSDDLAASRCLEGEKQTMLEICFLDGTRIMLVEPLSEDTESEK